MNNRIFYSIFEREEWFEYHVSAERQDVVSKSALSSRIPCKSTNAAEAKARWLDEARLFNAIEVTA